MTIQEQISSPEITDEKRKRYARQLMRNIKRLDNWEEEHIRRMLRVLDQAAGMVTSQWSRLMFYTEDPSAFSLFRISELAKNLDNLYAILYNELARVISDGTGSAFKMGVEHTAEPIKQLGYNVQFFRPSLAQVNVINDFNAALVTDITTQVRKLINIEVRNVALGVIRPIEAMANITKKMGLPPRASDPTTGIAYRAERIVRTETNRIYNMAVFSQQLALYKDFPSLRKSWVAIGDERTRNAHLHAHQQWRPIDEPYLVMGESLMYPLDPVGSPRNVIQCRCRSITIYPEASELAFKLTPRDQQVFNEIERRKTIAELAEQAALLKAQAEAKAEEKRRKRQERRRRRRLEKKIAKQLSRELRPLAIGAEDFPEALDELEFISELGGSTGASLWRDKETGKLYVQKEGASSDHIQAEYEANLIYRAAGIRVPRARMYTNEFDQPVMVTEFIKGRLLNDLRGQELLDAYKDVQKGFAVDAWLAHWDVIGLEADNIIIDANGHAWRVDLGGAFEFRAQGDIKPNALNPYPTEFWSLRHQYEGIRNRSATAVFNDMDYQEIIAQAATLLENPEIINVGISQRRAYFLRERLTHVRDMVDIYRDMAINDVFRPEYVDGFTLNVINLKRHGMDMLLPKYLTYNEWDGSVTDDKGKKWDQLRGQDSIIDWLADYIRAQKFTAQYQKSYQDPIRTVQVFFQDIISEWAYGQSLGSWSKESKNLKYLVATKMMNVPNPGKDFFWGGDNIDDARNHWIEFMRVYPSLPAENQDIRDAIEDVYQVWHAFNYHFARSVAWEGNDIPNKRTRVIRTETNRAMYKHNMETGARNVKMTRGPAESGSLFKKISVHGNRSTVQWVPHHRLFGFWFFERNPYTFDSPDYNQLFHANELENEVIFLPYDLPFDYVRPFEFPIPEFHVSDYH